MRQARTNEVKQRRSVVDTMAFKKNLSTAKTYENAVGDHLYD